MNVAINLAYFYTFRILWIHYMCFSPQKIKAQVRITFPWEHFFGYNDQPNAYRLQVKLTKQLIIFRNVTFD